MNLARRPPVIEVVGSWQQLWGCLFGVMQPAIIGRVKIAADQDIDLRGLDAAIAAIAEELQFEPPNYHGAAGLASRVAGLSIALQIYFQIPLSTSYHVQPLPDANRQTADFQIALPHLLHGAALATLDWVIATFNRLLASYPTAPDVRMGREAVGELHAALRNYSFQGVNRFHFVRSAHQLGIPVRPFVGGVFRYGTGCHTRLLDSTVTDRTSHIGFGIASSKVQTAHVLRRAGLPAPRQKVVTSEEQALLAAEQLGYPVVLKPITEEQGRGVFAGLRDAGSLAEVFSDVTKFGDSVLVEKHVDGKDYRLTVMTGSVIKVMQRIAGGVIGDGKSTISELVEQKQAEPRLQRQMRKSGKMVISLDDEALSLISEQGCTPDSVVANGDYVQLRRKNNISTGAEQIAIPVERVHPDNRGLAIRAADLLNLDFAGVDLIIEDIERSWMETGALICEVNSKPQIGVLTSPTIYGDILREIFEQGSRIPAHLLLIASNREPDLDTCLELASKLSCNGVSSAQGVWVGGERLPGWSTDGFANAQTLLSERTAQGALCVMQLGEIVRKGLPIDRFDSIRIMAAATQIQSLIAAVKPHTDKLIGISPRA